MDAGQRLGMYRLVERLGRGGFAEVWRARPEPATAFGEAPTPETLALATKALAALLRGAPASAGQAPGVLAGLAEQQERLAKPGSGAPGALLAAEAEAARAAFRWVEELAAGGDLDVAVKVPFHDGWVRQLRREKDVLRRVEHPRLVRQLELDVAHEPPFLAMELVRGWSLRDALKSEPRPPVAKVLAIMDQLLTVLDHLHKRGVVHGDVKPENILLEPDGALRLIDLGLGQVSQAVLRDAYLSLSLASRVPILGTLSYMAPEVRKGQVAGPASDLYSAGIVLYEMLVGDVPHGMTLPSEAVPERELSPRFDVLLKWVLHPEPARRVPSAGELRERILVTLRERTRHQYGSGRGGVAREGTQSFDQWALGAASPFVAGDWVGPWQLEAPLGRGGFGEVWKAKRGPEAPPGPDLVALKIALGPHGKEGLQREAEVARRLSHPRIPAVRDAALAHDPPYLVVDFASGRSLRARLVEDGPLEPAELCPALASLVSALVHCHAAGVVHRDLKPENLLLDEEHGTLTLLDFGLATCPELEERQRVEVSKSLDSRPGDPHDADGGGTFEYMAPERRRGAPGAPPADAYAVGVIVFELLTGELPRGLTRLRELRPLTPPWLEALVARLLDPAPDARPSLAQVQDRLGAEGTPARTRVGLGRRGLQVIERRRATVLSVVGAALVLITLVKVGWPRPERRVAPVPRTRDPGPPADLLVPVERGAEVVLTPEDRRQLLGMPAATVDELKGLSARLGAARLLAPGRSAPLDRRLEAASRLAAQRGTAVVLVEEAAEAERKAAALPDAEGRGLAYVRVALSHLARADEALADALARDPDGPSSGAWEASRARLLAARLQRQARGLALLCDAAQPQGTALDELLPDDPVEAAELVGQLPPAWRERLGAGTLLARRTEELARRGDLRGVAAITSSAVLGPLLGAAAGRAHAALDAAWARRERGRALLVQATGTLDPDARLAMIEEGAGLLSEAERPWRVLAHARAGARARLVVTGTSRRTARSALWTSEPDAWALAVRLSPEDGGLRVAALGLLGELPSLRDVARQHGVLAQLEPLILKLSGVESAVEAAKAGVAAAPQAEEPRLVLGRARLERALVRQALRDAADPLP